MLSAKLLIILMMLAASEARTLTYAICQAVCHANAVGFCGPVALLFLIDTVVAGPHAPTADIMINFNYTYSLCMENCKSAPGF